jgi:hypothetical protein
VRRQERFLSSNPSRGQNLRLHSSSGVPLLRAWNLLAPQEDPVWPPPQSPPLVPNLFKAALVDIGLTMCVHEPCAFIGISPSGGTIFFGTYVNDCMYFGSDDATELWFEQELGKRLTIDFMGELSYYLGVYYDWQQTPDGRLTVHCSQEGHIHRMLEQFHLEDAHAERTPFRSGLVIDRNLHDGRPAEAKPALVKEYQSLVGGLNWVSLCTRPDITVPVCLLASYLHNPSQGHLDSAKYVLRYLKGTMDWGIRFTQAPAEPTYSSFDPADCLNAIVSWPTDDTPRIAMVDRMDAYTDSNWGPQDASRPKPGKTRTDMEMYSLLGAAVTYMGGPLDWRSVREKQASRSICESEIRGMDEGTKMVLALRHLFEDFGATHLSTPTPILYSDNQGGVAWARSEAITKNSATSTSGKLPCLTQSALAPSY